MPKRKPSLTAADFHNLAKPPYNVPRMAAIQAKEPNGLSLVSTFSGCGGSCLGFRMAGYKVLWASEFVPAAYESYLANADRATIVDNRDIRTVTPEEILRSIKRKRREIDVLEGSPPCSSFSTAGKRSEGWGKVTSYSDTKQRTDDLFFEFVRILDGLQPKVFVAENVSGLVKGVAKGFFLEILGALKATGYNVECRVLDAQWLGVPQARARTIFVGVRKDIDRSPAFPEPFPYQYSIADAIPRVRGGRITGRTGGKFKRIPTEIGKPMNTIQAKDYKQTRYEIEVDMEAYSAGAEWDKTAVGAASKKYFQLVKANPSKPCPTVTAIGGRSPGTACVVHPFEKRKFTIEELKRLCSFPDDFVLTGDYGQQWERLGRSVPPLMMKAIAERIRDDILRVDGKRFETKEAVDS